jgi:hypothetical protein
LISSGKSGRAIIQTLGIVMPTSGLLSTPVENSSFRRSKNPPPGLGEGLHFQPIGVKMIPAGEAEAGSAGVQPAEE